MRGLLDVDVSVSVSKDRFDYCVTADESSLRGLAVMEFLRLLV